MSKFDNKTAELIWKFEAACNDELKPIRLQYERHVREVTEGYQEQAQSVFFESVKQFFTDNPTIQAITWNQYIPEYNDGEECRFTFGEACFLLEGFDINELAQCSADYEENDRYKAIRGHGYYRDDRQYPQYQACIDFNNMLCAQTMMLEFVFGSNAFVVITPTKMIVQSAEAPY